MIDQFGMENVAEQCPSTILVVDDVEGNRKMLRTLLSLTGYVVVEAVNGQEALERIASKSPDLVLLDILMPVMDGYEACRRIREDEKTRFLPVVMITASGDQEKIKALEAGADDFIMKPFNQAELLARVKSLVRIKQFQDTIAAQAAQLAKQAAELAQWNQRLEQRVHEQVQELERVGRLRRFLSPQLAEIIVSSGDDSVLDSHRREVTVVFCDLRGFTAFSANNEPEEVMSVLRAYHAAMGELVFRYGGTLERFAGDGMMVFFNDPIPCEEPTACAVRMAVEMRQCVAGMIPSWRKRGYDLGLGIGIAQGYATLGKVGFEGRFDYAAIGPVTNLASRLCDEAQAGQILLNQRAFGAVEDLVQVEQQQDFTLKGFVTPVQAFNLVALKQ